MTEVYRNVLAAVRAVADTAQPPAETVRQAMRLIHEHLPHYEWVGVYVLNGDQLDLGPYVGAPTVHTRIPVGTGVCGTAVLQGRNQRIEDVRALHNYLACSAGVRSEIVVLVRLGDEIVGQIDADSDAVGAFTPEDEHFLTELAALLAPAVASLQA